MKRNACFTGVSFYTLNVTMNYITKRFTHTLLTFLANTLLNTLCFCDRSDWSL